MNKTGFIILLLLAAASARGAAIDRDSLAQFRVPGVPDVTYQKVVHGDPLKLDDVAALSRAGVSHAEIIAYLYSYGGRFKLTPDEALELKQQGVTSDLLDYIISPPAQMPRIGF